VPFYIGSASIVLGIIVLVTGHRLLDEAERAQDAEAERGRAEREVLAEDLGSTS
jgi:ACDE family multidrug resistance protein